METSSAICCSFMISFIFFENGFLEMDSLSQSYNNQRLVQLTARKRIGLQLLIFVGKFLDQNILFTVVISCQSLHLRKQLHIRIDGLPPFKRLTLTREGNLNFKKEDQECDGCERRAHHRYSDQNYIFLSFTQIILASQVKRLTPMFSSCSCQ